MDEKDNKTGNEFKFFNERVVENKRLSVYRLMLHMVFGGVFLGILACIVFYMAKPYVKELLKYDTGKSGKFESDSEMDLAKDTEVKTVSEGINSIDEVMSSVIGLVINEEDDWKAVGTDNNNFSCGLVLEKNSEIKLLVSYDFVEEADEVSAYIYGEKCTGTVKGMSKEYGFAIVSIDATDLEESIFEKIKCADIDNDSDYEIGDNVIFVGNPYGKERFMANGSLTSVGNAYNIVDVAFEILTTDISETGDMNGFLFDSDGNVVGMVDSVADNSNIGDNVISVVSFKGISSYIERLLKNNRIPYLGIYGKVVTDDVIASIDGDMPYGIYISNTEEDSPAYVAGIMNGDIIIRFCGKYVKSFEDFNECLMDCDVSEEVIVTVMRKGKSGYKEINYTVKIGGR
jgi:S1-C subfamily serine protease